MRNGPPIPLLSIVDATAEVVEEDGLDTVGLLGSSFTMEEDFFKKGLADHGIETILPSQRDRKYVHEVIFGELVNGEFLIESKEEFLRIIEDLKERGAQGIILGCTEIPLLVKKEDTSVKLFNTTTIHAEKALNYALDEE